MGEGEKGEHKQRENEMKKYEVIEYYTEIRHISVEARSKAEALKKSKEVIGERCEDEVSIENEVKELQGIEYLTK